MAYIYCADIYCDDCGLYICKRIKAEGKAPEDTEDEYSYDSNQYPKHASNDDESDSPQHCGSGETCINHVVLPSGQKIGALLSTNLTLDGVTYLQDAINQGGEVAEYWYREFSDAGYDLHNPNEESEEDEDE